MTSISPTRDILKLSETDISGLIALSESVGWDYAEPELRTVLASGTIYGIKNNRGQIVASAAIIPYGRQLASIGLVIVHPEYRRLGLGQALIQTCITTVSPDTIIQLIATKEGEPLYEKLGFQKAARVCKLLCERYRPPSWSSVREAVRFIPMTHEHIPEVIELDRRSIGADRSRFLQTRIKQAEHSFVAQAPDGTIAGFGLSIQGPVHLTLGPITAPNDYTALALVDSLANGHPGKLRIDVAAEHPTFPPLLEVCGFINVAEPPVMVLHSPCLPPRNGNLYSIAAQIFG
ncbi:GNAT family N-acetyltransferase [Paenibacillus elgii]|uniref:GNAT family N-acetyltransferase n=1 Tax=Paenibacillus elgii TaxID=189691 RepID=UPI000FD6418D|nr:GNAT family N-acetyltransferase [Paenibacillus elgii]NEN86607.1 GNAT family N-acetyltransferase [Paenibacillus elgii]